MDILCTTDYSKQRMCVKHAEGIFKKKKKKIITDL